MWDKVALSDVCPGCFAPFITPPPPLECIPWQLCPGCQVCIAEAGAAVGAGGGAAHRGQLGGGLGDVELGDCFVRLRRGEHIPEPIGADDAAGAGLQGKRRAALRVSSPLRLGPYSATLSWVRYMAQLRSCQWLRRLGTTQPPKLHLSEQHVVPRNATAPRWRGIHGSKSSKRLSKATQLPGH